MIIQYKHKGETYIYNTFVFLNGEEYRVDYACTFERFEDGVIIKEKDWGLVPTDSNENLKTIRINEL